MNIMPTWKICRKCRRPYSYNPSVGEYRCPECFPVKNPIWEKVRFLCGRIKENK